MNTDSSDYEHKLRNRSPNKKRFSDSSENNDTTQIKKDFKQYMVV